MLLVSETTVAPSAVMESAPELAMVMGGGGLGNERAARAHGDFAAVVDGARAAAGGGLGRILAPKVARMPSEAAMVVDPATAAVTSKLPLLAMLAVTVSPLVANREMPCEVPVENVMSAWFSTVKS